MHYCEIISIYVMFMDFLDQLNPELKWIQMLVSRSVLFRKTIQFICHKKRMILHFNQISWQCL